MLCPECRKKAIEILELRKKVSELEWIVRMRRIEREVKENEKTKSYDL